MSSMHFGDDETMKSQIRSAADAHGANCARSVTEALPVGNTERHGAWHPKDTVTASDRERREKFTLQSEERSAAARISENSAHINRSGRMSDEQNSPESLSETSVISVTPVLREANASDV